MIRKVGYAPEELEDTLHTSHSQDLVLDLLPARRDLVRRKRKVRDRARIVAVGIAVERARALRVVLLARRALELLVRAHREDREQHLRDLLAHERQRPRERVHEVRQPVRVRRRVVLPAEEPRSRSRSRGR